MNMSVKKIHCLVTQMILSLTLLVHPFLPLTPSVNQLIHSALTHSFPHLSQQTLHVVNLNYSEASRPAGTRFTFSSRALLPQGVASLSTSSSKQSSLFFFFLSWQNNLPTERSKKNILGPTSGACLLAVTRHAIVRSTPRRCTGACGVEE